MSRASHSFERFLRFGPVVVAAMALALLWMLLSWSLRGQEERAVEDAQSTLDVVNRSLAEQTAGLLRGTRNDLRLLSGWMQAHPGRDPLGDAELVRMAATLANERQGLVTMHLASTNGELLNAPQELAGLVVPISQEDSLADPQRVQGRTVMPMAMAVKVPGSSVGAVVALIDIDRLVRLYESLRVRDQGSILLLRSDGMVLLRAPLVDGLVGRHLPLDAPTVAMMVNKLHGEFVTDGSFTDGVRRLATFRRVEGFPITVAVAQGYDETLAAVHARKRVIMAVCAGLTLFLMVAVDLIWRAQSEARQRRVLLAAMSDNAPVGMFRAEPNGMLSYVNDAYLRMHGLQSSEAADGWLMLMPESRRDAIRVQWQHIVQRSEPWHAVRRIKRQDGATLLVAIDTNPVVVDGKVQGHVGIVRDITAQANGERALRTLAAVSEATTDFVTQTDASGHMVYMNPAARRVAGVAPTASIEHLHFTDLLPPATVARYEDEMLPAAMQYGVWSGETVLCDAQRRSMVCSQTLIAHRDGDGRVSMFSAVMRDMSAAKAAQQVVERSETTLRAVAEAMPAVVAVVDRHQRYMFVNAAFERWQGRSRDTLMGRTMLEILGAEDHARCAPWLERALAGETVSYELEYESSEQWRHVRNTHIPLRGADGKPEGFVAVVDDITEHRTEAERLRKLSRMDALTGALNRAGFEHLLGERGRRGGQALAALLFIDLDRFKVVNDTYGHAVGDLLLKAFSDRVRTLVRPTDVLARLGGDEFVILLEGLRAPANAEQVADKVVAAAREPFDIGGTSVQIGASIGIALWPENQRDWRSLLSHADAMLYRAKRSGRGQHQLAMQA